MSLEKLRARLDGVDAELIELLARRASVVAEIWAWKQQHGVARIDPPRELEVRARLLAQADALGLSREAVSAVLDQLIGRPLRK
jgi:chorismate mutase